MSELKVYRDPKEGPCYREFYEKSKADKVIAEKDAEIAELKEQYKDMDVTHTVHIAKMNARIEELEARIAELEQNLSEIQSQKMQFEDDVALLRRNNAELKEAQRWRKCSEELPEEYTDVLFVDSDGTYYLGDMMLIPTDGIKPAEQYWSGRGEPRCNNPKYWLPLPKAPEEVK